MLLLKKLNTAFLSYCWSRCENENEKNETFEKILEAVDVFSLGAVFPVDIDGVHKTIYAEMADFF